jgi:hypothetical protein
VFWNPTGRRQSGFNIAELSRIAPALHMRQAELLPEAVDETTATATSVEAERA